MNRKTLISLIILDVIVMLLALGLLLFRYHSLLRIDELRRSLLPAAAATAPVPERNGTASVPSGNRENEDIQRELLPAVETRNIGFTYRNSKAKRVQIIGDFNDWIPAPMTRSKDYRWTVSIPLQPGEYAYNYVVDGKPVRDRNNPKVCDVGRGFPNSFLKVKSIADDKEQ